MFRNLFGWLRSRKTSSQNANSFRPRLESLEDRTVPDAVPPFAAVAGLAALNTNPTLSSANALLNNQLSNELILLPSITPASANQLLGAVQSNPALLGNLSSIPNLVGNTFSLLGQESALAADLAALVADPFLAANQQFAQSVNSLANSISVNPLFQNPAAFLTVTTGNELMLQQGLSPSFSNGALPLAYAFGLPPINFGSSANFNLSSISFDSSGLSNAGLSGFPFGFLTNPEPFTITESPQGATTASSGLGEGNAGLTFGFGMTATPYTLNAAAYGPFSGMPGAEGGFGIAGQFGMMGFSSGAVPFGPSVAQPFGFDSTINPTTGML